MPPQLIRKPTLRRRIVLPFVLLVLFVGVVGSAVISAEFTTSTDDAFTDGLVGSAARTNDRIASLENDRLQQLRAATNTAGIDTALKRADANGAASLLRPIIGNAQPEHLTLRVLTANGQPVLTVRRGAVGVSTVADSVNLAGQPAVQHALRGDHDALGDKYLFTVNEGSRWMVYWVSPVHSQVNGTTVVGAMMLGQALDEIAQSFHGSSNVQVAFYDAKGNVLASSLTGAPSLSGTTLNQVRGQAPVVTRTPVTGHPYGFLINDWTMRGRSLGYVAVAMDAQFVQDSLAMARVILVMLFAATALGTIILGLVLADRITRPIDQLIASMHGVSTGDYERRVAVDSADEIGFLGQAFNNMASALHTQRREREEGYFRNLEALARAIDARDPYTFEHSARVAAISVILATAMDWPADEVASLRRAGLLHDVGKIGVADRILAKISPLTDDEWASIRQHPIIGYDMLKDVPFLQASLAGIRHHHERWDGEGYPDGLTAEENPAPARIVAVADAFDAMTSDRPYRKGFSFGFAAKTIASESGRQFDPAVVAAFVKTEPLILAKLEEMGKKPAPHAADIRLDEAA